MKKNLLNLWMVMMLGIVTVFSSCSKEDDVTPTTQGTEKATTYTIMFYGCGGGDLDKALNYNIGQIGATDKLSHVNFTGLVKFSKPYQQKASCTGTRFLNLTEKGLVNEKRYEANYRLDNPEHLTKFIKETKEKMPADKYILVLWNHGTEFGLDDKLVQSSYPETSPNPLNSRAMLYDDNLDSHPSLSIYELEKGIKDAGMKFDLIYLDLCNMGMVETHYQLKDCAHYLMSAAHPTPGLGANYTLLMHQLQNQKSLEDAIKAYVPACVRDWKTYGEGATDLECYDLTYMDELANHVKTAVSQLTKLRDSKMNVKEGLDDFDPIQQDKILWHQASAYDYKDWGKLYIFPGRKVCADMNSTFVRMAEQGMDGKLSSYATLIQSTIEKMTVVHGNTHLPNWLDRISMGIIWPTEEFARILEQNHDNYQKRIDHSAFNQYTGWGNYLKTNKFLKLFAVSSAFDANDYTWYEGVISEYTYLWRAEVSVATKDIPQGQANAVNALLDQINAEFSDVMKGKKYVLRHGQKIMRDAHKEAMRKIGNGLKAINVNKFHIKVSLVGTVNPQDPDAKKYPAIIEKDF